MKLFNRVMSTMPFFHSKKKDETSKERSQTNLDTPIPSGDTSANLARTEQGKKEGRRFGLKNLGRRKKRNNDLATYNQRKEKSGYTEALSKIKPSAAYLRKREDEKNATRITEHGEKGDAGSMTAALMEDGSSSTSSSFHLTIFDSPEQLTVKPAMSVIDAETNEINQENLEHTDDETSSENGSDHESIYLSIANSNLSNASIESLDIAAINDAETDEIHRENLEDTDNENSSEKGSDRESRHADSVTRSLSNDSIESLDVEKINDVKTNEIHQENLENKNDDVSSGDGSTRASSNINSASTSPSRDSVKSLEIKPIIDPKTHEINKENLGRFANELHSYIASGARVLKFESKELKNVLRNVENLSKLSESELSQAQLGLNVRDCYSKMEKACCDWFCCSTNETERHLSAVITALVSELKRHHLSNAATPVFKEYADKEARRLQQTLPGLYESRAGALANDASSVSVKAAMDGVLGDMEAGVEVKKDSTWSIDDDNEQMYTRVRNAAAKLTLGLMKFMKASSSAKIYIGGQYRKTTDVPNMVKILGADKANHSSLLERALLMGSAGPSARKMNNRMQKAKNFFAVRRLNNKSPVPLYLSADKVAKGAYNQVGIHLCAEVLDGLFKDVDSGSEDNSSKFCLHEMIKAAYPEHKDVVDDLREKGETPSSVMAYVPLPALSSGTTKRGKEPKTTITGIEGGLEFAITANKSLKKFSFKKVSMADFKYLFDMRLNAMARRRETSLERLKPMHAMTTASYTKDIRVSLNLWDKVERAYGKDPKFLLYRKANEALSVNSVNVDGSTLLPRHDIDYFGPEIDIPKTFLGTVRAPKEKWGGLLDNIEKQLGQLQKTYDEFEQVSGKLYLENRFQDPESITKGYADKRKEAFKKIVDSVWGGEYKESGDVKDKGIPAIGNDLLELVADSHDAISTALGSMGTHLEIIKAKLMDSPNPDSEKELIEKIKKADASYKKLSKAVEAANIPVAADPLYRFNTVAWGKVSTKNELEGQLKVVTGGDYELLPTILSEETDLPISMDLQDQAAQVSAEVGIKYTQQDHPNYARKGDFIEISISCTAGAPFDLLAKKAMDEAAQKWIAKGSGKLPVTEKELKKVSNIISKAAAALEVTNKAKGYQMVLRWHKYAELPENEYEFQYLKLLEKNIEEIKPSVTIPSLFKKIPSLFKKLTLGWSSGQEIRNPVYEYMGRDLGHHIINFNHIDKLHKEAKKNVDEAEKKKAEEQAGKTQPSGSDSSTDSAKDTDPVLTKLAELLEDKKNGYKKAQFFSSNSIFDVVKDYQEFVDWKKNKNGEPPRNGFAFYDLEKIQELVKVSRKAESTAAGSGWSSTQKAPLSTLRSVPDKFFLEEVEEKLKGFETDDERVEYFLQNQKGRAVFKAYLDILATYKEMNSAATTVHSYTSYLRAPKSKIHGLQQFGKTIQNAVNVVADAFRGHRALPDGAPKADAFLSEKGVFEKDVVNHGAIMEAITPELAKRTAQTDNWLKSHRVAVVRSGFTGIKGLVVAYLQQVTGRYDKLHREAALKYIDRVKNQDKPTPEEMEYIIREINKDYGVSTKVHLVTPGKDGHPVWTGDLNASKSENGSSVVILRGRNDKDEETFAALAHKGEIIFDEVTPRENVDMQLYRLDEVERANEQFFEKENQAGGITGTKLREIMKDAGERKTGKMEKLTEKLADIRQPLHRTVRSLNDTELKSQVQHGYEKGKKNLWREAKLEEIEREKRAAQMRLESPSSKEKAGKDLREIKKALEIRESSAFKAPYVHLKHGAINVKSKIKYASDKDAKLMMDLKSEELNELAIARHTTEDGKKVGSGLTKLLNPATTERQKREKMVEKIKDMLKPSENLETLSLHDLKKTLRGKKQVLRVEKGPYRQDSLAGLMRKESNKTLEMPVDPLVAASVDPSKNFHSLKSFSTFKTKKNEGLSQVSSLTQIRGLTSEEEGAQLTMFGRVTAATDKWFNEHNYEIAGNTGDRNNCLLIALMQQVTGLHEEKDLPLLNGLARFIRIDLEKEYGIPQDTMLVAEAGSNDKIIADLMNVMARHLNDVESINRTKDQVIVVTPYEGGIPFAGGFDVDKKDFRAMNEDEVKNLEKQLMIVYGRNGSPHYEAVIKKGS